MARVSDRIRHVQDVLGRRIAIENSTWYTNRCDMPEADFLAAIAERADCQVLLDLNNIVVNHKNHGGLDLAGFIARVDLARVSYLHVAGHEFDADAYPAFGGRDAAPSPLFYALGALTSCNQVTASLVAKDLGITLGEFTFRVQGDLDLSLIHI